MEHGERLLGSDQTVCIGCPDFVDFCAQGACNKSTPDKYHHTTFYLGMTFCEHLTAEYGTDDASHYAHFRREHEGDDCDCVTGNWWPGRPRPTIPEDDEACDAEPTTTDTPPAEATPASADTAPSVKSSTPRRAPWRRRR